MTKQLFVLLLIPIALTACGQVTMEEDAEGGQDDRDLLQESVEGEGSNTALNIAVDRSVGTISSSGGNASTVTINVPPGISKVPVTITVQPQYEVTFIANSVSIDSFVNISNTALQYTAQFTLPITGNANIIAVSQTDNSRALYTINFIYDENALSTPTSGDGSSEVSSDTNSGPALTFEIIAQGQTISSSEGIDAYEINIGAQDEVFTVNASVASGVDVEFLLNDEYVDRIENNSQARKTKRINFASLNVRMMRMKAKMIVTSSTRGSVETINLHVRRDLGMRLINTSAEVFAVPPESNEYSVHNIAYDGDRVIIGLPNDDGDHNSTADSPNTNMSNSGAARIYVRSEGGWELESHIKADETAIGIDDNLGWSVAISGDLAFVGAPGEDSAVVGQGLTSLGYPVDNRLPEAGIVHVYQKNASNDWEFYCYIKPPRGRKMSKFGQNLAVAENEDGSLMLAVSATNLNIGILGRPHYKFLGMPVYQTYTGKVAIYHISEGDDGYNINYKQNIFAPYGRQENNSGFGFEIAISEKYLVIAEPFKELIVEGETDRNFGLLGEVVVYSRPSVTGAYRTRRSLTGLLDTTERMKTVSIGNSLAIEDNFIFVGASNYTPSDTLQSAGAVYVFNTGSGASWGLVAKITSDNQNAYDLFGYDISTANKRLIIGAPGDNGGAESTLGNYNNTILENGAVFVYSLNESGHWKPYGYFTQQVPFLQSYRNFGRTVKAYGDYAAIYSGAGVYFF